MVRLSDKAISVISNLEFKNKYYFKKKDIEQHFDNKKQLYDFIYNQRKNNRIIKLNKDKYFLVPIKARHRAWTDHPLIIAHEIMDGKDYYVGGWYAAHYWGLTEQVPMQVDIYSPNKYGKARILNKRFVFHRIRREALKKRTKIKISGKEIFIIKKIVAEKWISKK